MEIKINTPFTKEDAIKLKAGDNVLLSGTIYTARDAAHKRLTELIEQGKDLPFDIKDSIVYYVGPTPARPGNAIGSAGPTTSYRMDSYTPVLLDLGLRGMIGKGNRSTEVINSIKKNNAIYFAAIGGAAALIGKSIISAEIVCYEDLGSEAIRRLVIKDLPLTVVIDTMGNDLYKIGQQNYLDSLELS